jgi:L-amino acid N-acyltransferase YncA
MSRRATLDVRPATADDAPGVQAIYAPIVAETAVSFEYEPPSAEEMARRIEVTLERLPWLVADNAGEVVGFAYAGPHAGRAAYAWSVDTSIYVAADRRGRGIGRALYDELCHVLDELGYVSAYAGITLPNEPSIALHESCGYVRVGILPVVGYKFGQWHDVGWWHRVLRTRPDQPAPPLLYVAP